MPGLIARAVAEVRRDIAAAQTRDPAARDVGALEILATWPGVHALLAHRLAHALHRAPVPIVPRVVAAIARSVTGIEIHPAAEIGSGFFIDHGMGVVIGETAEIGDDVTLYQGVTLGGTGFQRGKRHPSVGDDVVIGSGAKLLGPISVGDRAKIGANSVVIHDVPGDATVVGNPGHPVRVEGRRPEGPDADWVHLPDPIADAIKGLANRITALEQAGAEQQSESGAGGRDGRAEVRPLRRGHERSSAGDGDGDGDESPIRGSNRAVGPNPAGG
jgi:serine O-acetyltransferase